jgi:hypothetical protein
MAQSYRVVASGPDSEQWFDDIAAADAAVARLLRVTPQEIEPTRRRINLDPVVLRRDGARWRSRRVWNFRSDAVTVRVFEMLRIDEALYEH